VAIGKALRGRVRRSVHAEWTVHRERAGLLESLAASVAGRRADLLPIRWGRMAASPFGFFRGAAALFAADVGGLPTCGLEVQACGDAHLLNLGAYAAPDGHLVFDLNDFDETCRGAFEWDLRRLAASIVVGGRHAGVADGACARAAREMVRSYREALAYFSPMPVLAVARHEISRRSGRRPLAPIFTRAARNTPEQLLARATVPGRGGWARFRTQPPLLRRIEQDASLPVLAALGAYRETLGPGRQQVLDRYVAFDVAFKVVGTGSIGVEVYLVLLYGNGPGDPLFLQLKEEDASCWLPFVGARRYAREYPHQGRRTAEGQLRTQTVADTFLGWTRIGKKDFVVRQWSDHKASADVRLLGREAIEDYAGLCGEVLAKAHARTGDAAMLSGYCGRGEALDRALARFALRYANQAEADHARLRKAIQAGKLRAIEGV
jgi:uncharacterized protein (DUF2252 family)